MLTDQLPFVLLVLGTFCVAYLVAAIGPTGGLQLAVTSVTLPAQYVIPVHAWISAVSAAFRVTALRQSVDWRFVCIFALPSVLATGLAILIGNFAGYHWIKILIGLHIIADGLGLLAFPGAVALFSRGSRPEIAGAVTGFVTAFIGASGPLLWSLMKDRFPERVALSATHSACLIIQHMSKILLFGVIGLSILEFWPLLIATTAASLIGTWLGQRKLRRFDEKTYRRLLNIALVASGIVIVTLGILALRT